MHDLVFFIVANIYISCSHFCESSCMPDRARAVQAVLSNLFNLAHFLSVCSVEKRVSVFIFGSAREGAWQGVALWGSIPRTTSLGGTRPSIHTCDVTPKKQFMCTLCASE